MLIPSLKYPSKNRIAMLKSVINHLPTSKPLVRIIDGRQISTPLSFCNKPTKG